MLNKNFYKRQEYIKNNAIPMRKEIRKSLKNYLTDTYFGQLDKDSKKLVGLDPKLHGPGEELWVYPMDAVNDNIVLKPVSTKEIQALTHTGILEYGDKELDAIEKDKQARIEKAILENNEIWWHFTKAHTKGCTKEAIRKEREIQNRDIMALVSTFNYIYKNGLDEAQTKFDKQTDILITELREVIKKKNCCEQDKKKIAELTAKMKEECEKRLSEETTRLRERFESILMLEQARFEFEIQEKTRALHHQLQCRSLVDILYMACMEKHYYKLNLLEIEKKHSEQVECLKGVQDELKSETNNLKWQLEEKTNENNKLKENMKALCQEFRRLFSCHTNLPFEQLGFLPQFEKIFIDSVYEKVEQKEKSEDILEDGKASTIKSEETKSKETQPSTESSNDSYNRGMSDNIYGNFFMTQIIHQEVIFGMYRKYSEESEMSRLSEVMNAMVQQARHGLRTSILKWSQSEDELIQNKLHKVPLVFTSAGPLNSSDKVGQSLHRDSLTLLKEKGGFENKNEEQSNQFLRECKEPECQFCSIIDYDFPPHVAHLAVMDYETARSLNFSEYKNYTVEELKNLTQTFFDTAMKETRRKSEDNSKQSSKTSGISKDSTPGCSKRSSRKGSVTKKCKSVDMDSFTRSALKENEKLKEQTQYSMDCPTEVTKEIIQQIFIDHPSLTNCVLDL